MHNNNDWKITTTTNSLFFVRLTEPPVPGEIGRPIWINANRIVAVTPTSRGSKVHLTTDGDVFTVICVESPDSVMSAIPTDEPIVLTRKHGGNRK